MRFHDIHILESLTGGFSRRTGTRLHEMIEPLALAYSRQVDVHHRWIATQQELFDRLAAIATDVRDRARVPILHLETHGSPRGLQLASGEFVTWDHLRPALTDINIGARLNLFVMVAACDGLDLLTILRPTHRATARIIIGPNRTLTDGEVERANLAFYTTLFEMSDGIAAYNAMNDAIEAPSETRKELFTTMSAEVMFYSVMRGYFRKYGSEAQIAARVEGLIAPLALLGLAPHELAKRRSLGRAELGRHRAHFQEYLERFFFFDLQPENRERFNITFEQCWTGESMPHA